VVSAAKEKLQAEMSARVKRAQQSLNATAAFNKQTSNLHSIKRKQNHQQITILAEKGVKTK